MEKEKIAELFMKGIDCSQVVAGAFAVVGAMIVLGLKFGHCDTEHMEQKDIMNAKRAEFLTKFQEKYGVCSCKGLLKHDIADPEGMQKILEEGLLFDFCPEIVRDTIEILNEVV